MSNLDLLPRADLPVIWNEFRTKAETLRETAENLNVTSIDQKEDMVCARRVRLTLREIRIAVEHKRVELGEGHLKEIQKVNGAAKAIREFIEPLEARLLVQETFAERAEKLQIEECFKVRFNQLCLLRPGRGHPPALGSMSPSEYLKVVAEFTRDRDELEAANRLRIEAERKLAEQQAEAARIRDEQFAVLEAELKVERAAKQAEADSARKLALAPDAVKLIAYVDAVRSVPTPMLHSEEATTAFNKVSYTIAVACGELRIFGN